MAQLVFVGFDGFQVLDIAGPLEVFNKANHHMPETTAKPFRYELIVATLPGG